VLFGEPWKRLRAWWIQLVSGSVRQRTHGGEVNTWEGIETAEGSDGEDG
jgi:hypothetical protein